MVVLPEDSCYADVETPAFSREPLLSVRDLGVRYRGDDEEVVALHDVSFDVAPGETLGIIGESGSGKTSLALALLGLIAPPHGVCGTVGLLGEDLLALPEARRADLRWERIALVFQNSLEVLNPVLRVEEQLGEPLARHLQLGGRELRDRVRELLETVGLDPCWQDAHPHQLSGGMRQRVLLAMALSCEPDLLVVDEPTTSIDAIGRREILDMLGDLQERRGFGMIVISHDVAAVSELAERLIVLYGGQVMESGRTAGVIDAPRHPYTRGLLNASVELFPHKDLWGIPGEPYRGNGTPACTFVSRCTQAQERCRAERPALLPVAEDRSVRCHLGGIAPLLEAAGLSKRYRVGRRDVQAVGRVDLTVAHGETVALVGGSGAGKSTVAQIVAGYLAPDAGEVDFREGRVREGSLSSVEDGIQLVLQDPFGSVSHRLSVRDTVMEPLTINRIATPDERERRVREALVSVQLPADETFLRRHCHALSGGQRQRLAIARALVMRPALLIADEITAMLDVSTQANLLRLLKGLQNGRGFAMVYVTHDIHLARKVAERIVVLHDGHVVEEGSSQYVMERSCCCHTRALVGAALGNEGEEG